MIPPHEPLDEEARETSEYASLLAESIRDQEWSANYLEHPALIDARARGDERPVTPVALYVDAVPYSQSDSVVGFWVYPLVTERRFYAQCCASAIYALAVARVGAVSG